jgi:hypothetical protein
VQAMNFDFQYLHFAMDSREKIRAIKNLDLLHSNLLEIVVNELKNDNVISRVDVLGENQIEVCLRDAFHRSYEHPALEHTIETDPHYRGDFYRVGGHAVVAKVKNATS